MKKERTPRQPKVWEALLALIFVICRCGSYPN